MNDLASPKHCAYRTLILCALTAVLTGCETYHLRGVVVEGDTAELLVVDPADSRLRQHAPLPGAKVELIIDPNSISPKRLGEFKTDEDGAFNTTIDELGAGFLEYQLGLLATADGHRTLWQMINLPPRDKVLLVVIELGRDTYKPPDDLLNDTQRIGEQLMR